MIDVDIEADGSAGFRFQLPANSGKRIILLETVAFNVPFRQYIQIPLSDDDFDVSFFPEGGSMIQEALGRVAFKAMKSNGQSVPITGVVYDQAEHRITELKSEHLGKGSFFLRPESGKTYHIIAENDRGQSKRFDLPRALEHGYALSVSQVRNNMNVSVRKSPNNVLNSELYLLVHTRGVVQYVTPWDFSEEVIAFPKDLFPSGVLHLILFDAGMNPISERLVFVNNDDQAQVIHQTDRDNYAARSLVKNRVTLTDNQQQPLTGNFSVSVTSDHEVKQDSPSTILTYLLLTSDLRGHIENSAFYFQNTMASAWALDLLLLTQGWRRYDIAELAQERFMHPAYPLEVGSVLSGRVRSLLFGRRIDNIDVSAMSTIGHFFYITQTDENGIFHFNVNEFPDSTGFVVGVVPQRGMTRMELFIDEETFPKRTLTAVPAAEIDKHLFARYANIAELKFVSEHGIRLYHLAETTISGRRPGPRRSIYNLEESSALSREQIDRFPAMDIFGHLQRFPGVTVTGQHISLDRFRGAGVSLADGGPPPPDVSPLIILDGVPIEPEVLTMLSMNDIERIEVLKSVHQLVPFGMRGYNGVIVLHSKTGELNVGELNVVGELIFHTKVFSPLGFQTPIEFYAPKFDTPESQQQSTRDLRTTIHWQPVVQTDDLGRVSFEFFTADEATSYTVIIEGLTNDGKIIGQEEKIQRTHP
jgi:hypothetical protein